MRQPETPARPDSGSTRFSDNYYFRSESRAPPPTGANSTAMNRHTLLSLLSLCLLALPPARAQVPAPSATGTITGKIFNPSTGEYVRNAAVRIEETGQSAVSEGEGAFRLSPVPAGRVTLSVTYTGYRTATAKVDVAAMAMANTTAINSNVLRPVPEPSA